MLPQTFDSHDFIRMYHLVFPLEYAQKLNQYSRLKDADSQMAIELEANMVSLGIVKIGETVSPNIMNNPYPCAKWEQ